MASGEQASTGISDSSETVHWTISDSSDMDQHAQSSPHEDIDLLACLTVLRDQLARGVDIRHTFGPLAPHSVTLFREERRVHLQYYMTTKAASLHPRVIAWAGEESNLRKDTTPGWTELKAKHFFHACALDPENVAFAFNNLQGACGKYLLGVLELVVDLL